MKNHSITPFVYFIGVILIVSLACGPVSSITPTPVSQGGNVSTETSSGGNNGGAVNNIQDVQKATIQIESDGTFVDPQQGLEVNAAGRGSGFFIDPSGIAVTNNHVVTGAALIKVWVNGETEARNAQILGVSECSDLAVIKVEGSNFSYLNWYNQTPNVGLEVYTAGFPLGQPEFNLTKGIISKQHADGQTSWASLDHVLAHDATINPGNSGGPLVTADGQVVGINYASLKSADQYFAIDAATAQPIVDELKTGKDIDSIGINGTAFVAQDNSYSGIWISSVKTGSPADKAGIKAGDILVQMEGLVLATDGTMKDYCSILRTHKPTDALSVKVYRYSTGETLEGELNGAPLQVTQTSPTNQPNSGNSTPGTAPEFFTEKFTGDLSNWTYNVIKGDENKLTQSVADGTLTTQLDDPNLAVYYYYDPYVYTDVAVDLVYTNRGHNSNNVNLVCRYSDAGWYEFTVQNDGLYSIWAYDKLVDKGYHMLQSGGSTAIKTGKDTNEIAATCVGTTLTLYINGVNVNSLTDTSYSFPKGQVGFGVNVSADNPVTPVIVGFDSFTISQP